MREYVLIFLVAPVFAAILGPYDIPPELPPLNDENFVSWLLLIAYYSEKFFKF